MATPKNNPLKNQKSCDPLDIALKTFFLGPQSENSDLAMMLVEQVFKDWFIWRKGYFPDDGSAISNEDKNLPEYQKRRFEFLQHLSALLVRYRAEIPKFSPRYIGHMFSEVSLPALTGHILTLLHNPNNISGESAPVGVEIENEAIAMLAKMFGLASSTSGHFTSGGTIANYEAIVRAKERINLWLNAGLHQDDNRSLFEAAHMGWESFDKLSPASTNLDGHMLARALDKRFQIGYEGPVILVPENKHYSWTKAISLFSLGRDAYWPVALNKSGVLDISDLKKKVHMARALHRPILMVVSVAGTTEMGLIDPISEVQDYLDQLVERDGIHIWHHIDAAYGGFFASLGAKIIESLGPVNAKHINSIRRANSITIDPHKMAYIPYSCGAFLCANSREYRISAIDAPYLNLDQEKDKGPFTIEGSRSASGATAMWMTAKSMGLDETGFGRIVARTVTNADRLRNKLFQRIPSARIAPGEHTNIICFNIAYPNELLSVTNRRTQTLYHELTRREPLKFFVSKTILKKNTYGPYMSNFINEWNGFMDDSQLMLIRLCLMNPFIDSKEMNLNLSDEFITHLLEVLERIDPNQDR